jgi:hypothetical protein
MFKSRKSVSAISTGVRQCMKYISRAVCTERLAQSHGKCVTAVKINGKSECRHDVESKQF